MCHGDLLKVAVAVTQSSTSLHDAGKPQALVNPDESARPEQVEHHGEEGQRFQEIAHALHLDAKTRYIPTDKKDSTRSSSSDRGPGWFSQ